MLTCYYLGGVDSPHSPSDGARAPTRGGRLKKHKMLQCVPGAARALKEVALDPGEPAPGSRPNAN